MDFLVNILASLVSAPILFFLSTLFSRRTRSLMISAFGKLIGVDIETIYPDKYSSKPDVEAEIKESTQVDLLTGRGNDLENPHFQRLLGNREPNNKTRLRILLPETRHIVGDVNWTEVNDREIALMDRAYGGGLLLTQVNATVESIKPHLKDGGLVELRRFNIPHLGRILITDRYVFVTFYPHHTRAEHAKVIKFSRKGIMSDAFVRLFNLIWDNSR